MEATSVLRAAADTIFTKNDWGRCIHPSPECPCAIGHIERVPGAGAEAISEAYRALYNFVGCKTPYSAVQLWNNAPRRTAGEVVTTLRAAAASLEH
jgi:hypothetical protein